MSHTQNTPCENPIPTDAHGFAKFTKEMKNTHTILVPMMLPIHFDIIAPIFQSYGYNVEVLKTIDRDVIDDGLKNMHNDMCYPALIVIGQMINALKSGKYDTVKTAVMITQTGGGCRASNYIHLFRKALINSGFENVPVISLNLSGLEKDSGFKITLPMLVKACYAIIYGDILMCVSNQVKPYEKNKGDTQKVIDKWTKILAEKISNGKYKNVKKICIDILDDFKAIPKNITNKAKVGIVGEIFMKYSPLGNNNLEQYLIDEGAEPVTSSMLDFLLYCFANSFEDKKLYGISTPALPILKLTVWYLVKIQKSIAETFKKHDCFRPPSVFSETYRQANGFISRGVKMGEGWLLTSEMIEHIKNGINNIVCAQPFGCLPNHIVARGMIKKIKESYPNANIVSIDYDSAASKTNQENRIKLMLANARAELEDISKIKQTSERFEKLPT